MPFKPNNRFGSTSKRGKAKINTELKNYLEELTFEALELIDVSKLTNSEKMKFVNYSLPYLLNRLQSVELDSTENNPNFTPVVIKFDSKL